MRKIENDLFSTLSSITLVWQFPYIPYSRRIFWWADKGKIKFFTNSNAAIHEVRLLYVPAITEDMDVPDALLRVVIDGTVKTFAEFQKGRVVKQSIDGNKNLVVEGEANLQPLSK